MLDQNRKWAATLLNWLGKGWQPTVIFIPGVMSTLWFLCWWILPIINLVACHVASHKYMQDLCALLQIIASRWLLVACTQLNTGARTMNLWVSQPKQFIIYFPLATKFQRIWYCWPCRNSVAAMRPGVCWFLYLQSLATCFSLYTHMYYIATCVCIKQSINCKSMPACKH